MDGYPGERPERNAKPSKDLTRDRCNRLRSSAQVVAGDEHLSIQINIEQWQFGAAFGGGWAIQCKTCLITVDG